VLEPGDEWVRQANAPQDERRGEQRGGSEDGRSAKARPSPTAHASFVRAWSLLRAGDARRAAALFAEVERTAGDRDIAEDALYWRAVATAKAGDRAAAQALFEQFFRRFPSSSRAGEAATALGWLYIESGELAAARRSFERAENDPSAAVRASARDGLRRAAHP
jgi:TolA-binding protein